jgi:hypothetical protein
MDFGRDAGCHQAMREVWKAAQDGHYWMIDLDIRKYFDSIAQQPLREMFVGVQTNLHSFARANLHIF